MAKSVIIPKSGMGITEGEVVRWLKAEGDRVSEGEVIAEVETAKATIEIEAPASGVLARILVREGENAEVNTELATIED